MELEHKVKIIFDRNDETENITFKLAAVGMGLGTNERYRTHYLLIPEQKWDIFMKDKRSYEEIESDYDLGALKLPSFAIHENIMAELDKENTTVVDLPLVKFRKILEDFFDDAQKSNLKL